MKKFFSFCLLVVVLISQISLINYAATPLRFMDLVLVFLVYNLTFNDYPSVLLMAVFSGLILGYSEPFFPALFFLSLVITVIILRFLFINFFTNRSIYSLGLLGVIALITNNVLIIVFNNYIFYPLKWSEIFLSVDYLFFKNFIWGAGLDLLILFFLFFLLKKDRQNLLLSKYGTF